MRWASEAQSENMMAGRALSLLWAACLAFCLAAGLAAPANAEPEFRWKMQSLWQAGSINQTVFEEFCQRLGALSGGRLEVEPLPVSTVVIMLGTGRDRRGRVERPAPRRTCPGRCVPLSQSSTPGVRIVAVWPSLARCALGKPWPLVAVPRADTGRP